MIVIWAALALLASISQFYSGDTLIAIAFIVLFAVITVAVAYAPALTGGLQNRSYVPRFSSDVFAIGQR